MLLSSSNISDTFSLQKPWKVGFKKSAQLDTGCTVDIQQVRLPITLLVGALFADEDGVHIKVSRRLNQ